ncbi:hypothetical protein ABTM78_20520, partial [Acinetobacter baumannii]
GFGDAIGLVRDDKDHNRLAKVGTKPGEYIFAADKNVYHIVHDKVLVKDGNDWKEVGDKLPSFLKRNEDGSLQFEQIKINADDSVFDRKFQMR